MEKGLNVLFIHYHFPPVKNSGVYRNYFLVEAFNRMANDCFVITSDNYKVLLTDPLPISKNIRKFDIFTLDYRKLSGWWNKDNRAGAHFSEESKSSEFKRLLIRMQRSFPFNLLLAEGSIIYIMLAYFKARKIISANDVSVMYSSFMPYADHIIAWMLKRKFPHLIWIADFRDLQVEPIYKNTLWPGFQKKAEGYILKHASIVTAVSEGISSKLKAIHSNVHTITKGVTLRDPVSHFEKFTIHYSGSLFQEFRDPGPLFKVLQKLISSGKLDLSRISFLYAGKDGNRMSQWALECGVENIFINKGLLSRNEALELQSRAHINLLLTSASEDHSGLLTGKLFEYIESGREILCLIKGSRDREIEEMFQRYGLGSVLYDERTIELFVLDKYNEWLHSGGVKSHLNRDKIQNELSWSKQTEKLLQLVENYKNKQTI